ncbi:MAG: preprotein translocase subunit SecG [Bacteroidota bacterium]
MLYTVFAFLSILSAILLTLIVVIQNSKGGGLSSTFGASNLTNMIGTRRATQDIEKFTWYLLAAMFIFSFMANVTNKTQVVTSETNLSSIMEAPSAPPVAPNPGAGVPQGLPNGGAPQ